MSEITRDYVGFFEALQAFNRQPFDVRARVAADYFAIAAEVLDSPAARRRLILVGHRETARIAAR